MNHVHLPCNDSGLDLQELLTNACSCACCRYGRDNLFRQMVDVQFVAAMGPPGGGRAFVTNRLLRHFSTLACAQVRPGRHVRLLHDTILVSVAHSNVQP